MRRMGLAAMAGCVTVMLGLAGAESPAAVAQVAPAQEEFVPIHELPSEEQLPAAPLLVAAYAFVWVALVAYVWSVRRRMDRVERELRQALDQAVERERRI